MAALLPSPDDRRAARRIAIATAIPIVGVLAAGWDAHSVAFVLIAEAAGRAAVLGYRFNDTIMGSRGSGTSCGGWFFGAGAALFVALGVIPLLDLPELRARDAPLWELTAVTWPSLACALWRVIAALQASGGPPAHERGLLARRLRDENQRLGLELLIWMVVFVVACLGALELGRGWTSAAGALLAIVSAKGLLELVVFALFERSPGAEAPWI